MNTDANITSMCCAPISHSKWRKHCDYSFFSFRWKCAYCAICILHLPGKTFPSHSIVNYCRRCVLTVLTVCLLLLVGTLTHQIKPSQVCADSRMMENRNRIGIILLNNACISHVQQANHIVS